VIITLTLGICTAEQREAINEILSALFLLGPGRACKMRALVGRELFAGLGAYVGKIRLGLSPKYRPMRARAFGLYSKNPSPNFLLYVAGQFSKTSSTSRHRAEGRKIRYVGTSLLRSQSYDRELQRQRCKFLQRHGQPSAF
jgi:hypothetical protein